jgi:hypothetical protein
MRNMENLRHGAAIVSPVDQYIMFLRWQAKLQAMVDSEHLEVYYNAKANTKRNMLSPAAPIGTMSTEEVESQNTLGNAVLH